MMLFMTVFMAFIAWRLPAGVLIYWVTTNIWTIAQQYIQTLPRTGESNA
jgi:YidC/Oxa1 family membrane protein insertase